ncbi:MAG: flagellar M-ring protein FliF [Micrococcales bacterium 70-64]|nr:flagellar M-ring protein FliF [Leifsonia sp.]ODU64085.1 MAG: flagellar M-ring protein FliF [Leifsonia sp. SCN 70-46]OJX85776.1 MAG: flagellar M-ring protein FliF [Micrococcales bacterium 70-64]
MPKEVSAAFGRITHALREFTVAQRTIAIIGVAVLVVGAVALGAWFTRSQYSPLFSGLNGSDASAIVDQLDADGVPYQLTDGGQTILVPDTAVNSARLKAAAAGLPSLDNGGYALLDAMGVTASEFQQDVTYKRAIEGELASTIESIKGVRTASVKLAIPEKSVFVSEKQDPTASVFVDTEAGVNLSTDQVQAITHLTAASVDGLTPENVSVVSADGTVLSAVGTGATGSTDQQASTYEDRVRAAVQSMLDRVVGVGNATVAVAASMNLNSGQRVEETFTAPEGDPSLTEDSSKQQYTGTGAGANGTGVLGADSIAVPTDTTTGSGDGSYTSESTTKTNAINKVTETTQIAAGQIERQTVSVAVDKDAAAGMTAATLEGLVAAAAGIDEERGDAVKVELVTFAKVDSGTAASALEEARASELQSNITKIVTTAVPFAGAILLLIILMSGIRASAKRRAKQADKDLGEMTQVRDSVEGAQATAIDSAAAAGLLPPTQPLVAGPSAFAEFGPDLDEPGVERMRQEIDSLAAASPERMAEHLRTLMDDRSRA